MANLTTSAPTRTTSLTIARTWSTPFAIPIGRLGSEDAGSWWPAGLDLSARPPVGDIGLVATRSRGPGIRPSSTAILNPASSHPASRTVVYPVSSVSSSTLAVAYVVEAAGLSQSPTLRQVVAACHKVVVAVYKPRQQGHTCYLYDLRTGRDGDGPSFTHVLDPSVFADNYGRIGEWGTPCAIYEVST